jgi:Flp pilus assembly protein TadD
MRWKPLRSSSKPTASAQNSRRPCSTSTTWTTSARLSLAHAARPSIEADDVLAWALYRNGRREPALRHPNRAVRLGTRDALKLFHRGMIERCLGHRAEAREFLGRALALNPYFSLRWAPVARRLAG